MSHPPKPKYPAEQIALWADRLRDLSATGLKYAQNIYDQDRYTATREVALEMLALATAQSTDSFEP